MPEVREPLRLASLGVAQQAVFSSCRSYRYVLWREWWQDQLPRPICRDCADYDGVCPNTGRRCDPASYLMVIGLNPSTADEAKNDPTIRRCMGFAHRWGFGALCMTNLFAYRSTDPDVMKRQDEPVGPENDAWIISCAKGAGLVLAAWGKNGAFRDRASQVLKQVGKLYCLRLNADGSPEHPLYVPSNTLPQVLNG
jgi:hypothetical protein